MRILLLPTGLVLLALVLADMLATVTSTGAGPATRRIENGVWRILLRIYRTLHAPGVLRWGGSLGLFAAVGFWVLMLWTAWALVFLSSPEAIVHAESGRPASDWSRVYFAATCIATLGIGDYTPSGPLWSLLAGACTLMGMLVVTFSIAYALPIIDAAYFKRSVGAQIATFGLTPSDVVLAAWDPERRDCRALGAQLVSLAPLLSRLGEQHVTYPSLHFFTTRKHRKSSSINTCVLDEALTLIECGLEPSVAPTRLEVQPVREAIFDLLTTLREISVPAAEVPPPPSLGALRRRGLPVIDEARYQRRVSALAERRHLLATLLANDGWGWDVLFRDVDEEPDLPS
jgi:hypothetical protein